MASNPKSPTPSASQPTPISPFRPPILSLNPALNASINPNPSPSASPSSPSSFLARSKSLPVSPIMSPNVLHANPAASLDGLEPLDRPVKRKSHIERVARATREFRDVWIVPE